MKKILILTLFFYFIALFQTSFLVHFNFLGFIPNLILISILFLNFFENPKKNQGIWGATIAGFFWDIFSHSFLGLHILILVFLAVILKIILRNYIQPIFRYG